MQEQVWRLDIQITKLEAKIEKLLEPDDAKYRLALEQATKYVDRLDKWLENATARRNILLKILEYFCQPVDQKAEISEADYKEAKRVELKRIAAPSAAPDLVTGDITTEGHAAAVGCA